MTAAEYGGFSKVQFSELDPHLFYASSTLGSICALDVRSGAIARTYKGHAAPINDFLEVIQHKILVTAGDDFVCNVYDLTKEPKSAQKAKVEKETMEENKEDKNEDKKGEQNEEMKE